MKLPVAVLFLNVTTMYSMCVSKLLSLHVSSTQEDFLNTIATKVMVSGATCSSLQKVTQYTTIYGARILV